MTRPTAVRTSVAPGADGGRSAGSTRAGRWAGEIALLAAVLAVAVAWTCAPWAWDASFVFTETDAQTSALTMTHLQDVLTGRATLAEAPVGQPFPGAFGWTDWQLGQAVITLPIRLLGVGRERVYMLASLLGLLLTALACHAASRAFSGPGLHNVVAALVGGFGPLHLARTADANLLHHEWALLAPLLVGLGARGRPRLALLGGLLAGTAFHFGLYMGLHAVLAFVVVGAILARGRALGLAMAGLALGLLTAAPVAVQYLQTAARWGLSIDPGETVATSWRPASLFAPTSGAPLHASLVPMWVGDLVNPVNPGYLALGLALVGLVLTRGRRAYAVAGVALAAALLALGPSIAAGIPGPAALLGGNVRAPVRWMFLVHAAVSLWAAAAVGAFLRRLPAWSRPVLLLPVLGILLLELPRSTSVPARKVAPDAVYDLLQTPEVRGPLYERFRRGCACDGVPHLRAALEHGLPLAGEHVARRFQLMRRWKLLAGAWPRPDAVLLLEASGVRLVLEHPPLKGTPPEGLACRIHQRHRLCVLPERSLPPVDAVSPDGTGAWVGMRWTVEASPRVILACGEREEASRTEPWAILSEVRNGLGAPLDVFLQAPCPTPPVASSPGGVPLRLR